MHTSREPHGEIRNVLHLALRVSFEVGVDVNGNGDGSVADQSRLHGRLTLRQQSVRRHFSEHFTGAETARLGLSVDQETRQIMNEIRRLND